MNFTMPTSTASDLAGQVTTGLSTYSSIIILLVGLALAFFIIESIINALSNKNTNEK